MPSGKEMAKEGQGQLKSGGEHPIHRPTDDCQGRGGHPFDKSQRTCRTCTAQSGGPSKQGNAGSEAERDDQGSTLPQGMGEDGSRDR